MIEQFLATLGEVDAYRVVDLTHSLSESIPTWEGQCGFHQSITCDYADCTSAVKFRLQRIEMNAGSGTHMDVPAHCFENTTTVEQIDLQQMMAPYVVIDVSKQVHSRYLISKGDIYHFEKKYGKIKPDTWVMFFTGWDQFWHSPAQYHNAFNFPSISKEVAEILLERGCIGLGIDTLSPDLPDSGYPVHKIILGSGKYIIENVTCLKDLPPTGSVIIALPLKIMGGTESPVRLIGITKLIN